MTPSVRRERLDPIALAHPRLHGLRAWRVGNRVGESPQWCARSRTLLWIDVRAPEVLRLDPARATLERWTLPGVVGALGLAGDDGVVLALERGIALLDLDRARLRTLHRVDDAPAHNRLNDGKVSPSGRWFVFGSMDDRPTGKQPTGALHRVDRAGPVVTLVEGLTVANGIAFSIDGRTLFWSDSHAGSIWRAPWDESTGTIGAPTPLCTSDEAAGRPDGAAVDARGDYWSAGVSAGCLNRFSPDDGRLLERIAVPCRAPTMPAFGGQSFTTMYLTSLVRPGWTLGPEDHDGALLSWDGDSPGRAAPVWR